MATFSTVSEFTHNHPNEQEAMQCVFISPSGEIHQYIIHVEAWHQEIKNLMTSYVFVNGWQSMVQTIKHFR
jgi:hypothetical protein